MFGNRRLPELDKDTNMTDVNGAPGAMDEDGELDAEHDDTGTNGSIAEGEGDEAEEEEGPEMPASSTAPDDHSPLVQGLVVKSEHQPGMGQIQTTIVATIHTAAGIVSKRMVIPGGVTAYKLACLIDEVASW